jgi:acyl carrier protein
MKTSRIDKNCKILEEEINMVNVVEKPVLAQHSIVNSPLEIGKQTVQFEDILPVFEQMYIETEGLTADSYLSSNLGMDSQEVIELVVALEAKYKIQLPTGIFSRDLSIQEIIDLLQKQIDSNNSEATTQQNFEFYCEAQTLIERDVDTVYEALHHMEHWAELLPHVTEIEVLYDDGKYQEFLMTVASDPGIIKVRSIRNCDRDNKQITFFQPEPPRFLKHHTGGWKFIETKEGQCKVVTYHQWNLKADVAAEVFQHKGNEPVEHVKALLLEHAQFALSNWKRILEN